ncbi:hypothetical protein E4U23_005678 [Claviceps purpurea]|nr:hypothetical protein E4U23_005678 [Claviceps purpurea]
MWFHHIQQASADLFKPSLENCPWMSCMARYTGRSCAKVIIPRELTQPIETMLGFVERIEYSNVAIELFKPAICHGFQYLVRLYPGPGRGICWVRPIVLGFVLYGYRHVSKLLGRYRSPQHMPGRRSQLITTITWVRWILVISTGHTKGIVIEFAEGPWQALAWNFLLDTVLIKSPILRQSVTPDRKGQAGWRRLLHDALIKRYRGTSQSRKRSRAGDEFTPMAQHQHVRSKTRSSCLACKGHNVGWANPIAELETSESVGLGRG